MAVAAERNEWGGRGEIRAGASVGEGFLGVAGSGGWGGHSIVVWCVWAASRLERAPLLTEDTATTGHEQGGYLRQGSIDNREEGTECLA